MAILAATVEEGGGQKLVQGNLSDTYAGNLPREGKNKNEYFGTALLREGVMVGELTGTQTKLLNLILKGDRISDVACGGVIMIVRRSGPLRVKVDLSGEAPVVRVKIKLNATMTGATVSSEAMCKAFKEEFDELTQLCQSLKVAPFGYAEHAARQFATVDDWSAYNWRDRFAEAQVDYEIEVNRITT